jgi:hypothetical protein
MLGKMKRQMFVIFVLRQSIKVIGEGLIRKLSSKLRERNVEKILNKLFSLV